MKKTIVMALVLLSSMNVFSLEIFSLRSYTRGYDLEYFRDNVYAATDNGVLRYDEHDESFVIYEEKEKCLSGREVYNVIAADKNVNLLAFADDGVWRLALNDSWERIFDSLGKVNGMSVSDGKLFLDTEKGKYCYDSDRRMIIRESSRNYMSPHDPFDEFVLINERLTMQMGVADHIKTVSGKTVMLADEGYITLYDGFRYSIVYDNGSLFDENIVKVSDLPGGGTAFAGSRLNIYENGRFSFYADPLLDGKINDMIPFRNGLLIATKTNGLIYWNGGVKQNITASDGLSDNNITTVALDDNVIYAVSKYGIDLIDSRRMNVKKQVRGMDYFKILKIGIADDALLLLHKDRIVISRGKDNKVLHAGDLFNDILFDFTYHDGIVYIAGNMGLVNYDIATGEKNHMGAVNISVTAVAVRDEFLYASTDEGLHIHNLEDDWTKTYDQYDGIDQGRGKALYFFNGALLLVTEKGIDYIVR